MNRKLVICILILLNAQKGLCQKGKVIDFDNYAHSKSKEATEYYNSGHMAMEKHDYRKAIELYRLAIKEDPDYVDAYDNIGVAYRQINLLDSAAYYYLISIKKYPKGTIARRNLAVVEEKRGNFDKAAAYYREALAIDDKDPETYYGLMRVYGMQKKFAEALESGSKAEKYYSERNDPNIGDCYLMLCITHIFMNNKEKAKQYAQLAQNKGLKLDKAILESLE